MSQAIQLFRHACSIQPLNCVESIIARSKSTNRKSLKHRFTFRFQQQQQKLQSTVASGSNNCNTTKLPLLQLHRARTRTKISTISKRVKSTSSKRSIRRKSTTPYPKRLLALSSTGLQETINRILLKPRRIPIPRWITLRQKAFNFSECFGHASFFLVAVSYAVDDFLFLRIIAVAGSSAMLVFTYFHPHGRVLWLPFKWNALFIGINAYRIGKTLYYKHKGMNLGEEITKIKRDYFDIMDIQDFAQLVDIAIEETFEKGDIMCLQGRKNPFVRLVIEGELDAFRDGFRTYSIQQGNFVTEAGLHAGLLLDGTIEASCTIVAKDEQKTKCLRWNRTELVELLKRESGLRRAFKAILSWDIVRKLKGQRQTITDHLSDPALWTMKRKEQTEDRYAAIVQNVLTSSRDPENMKKRTSELDHYRTIHHIDDVHHELALKKIGWTLEDYHAGMKKRAKEFL